MLPILPDSQEDAFSSAFLAVWPSLAVHGIHPASSLTNAPYCVAAKLRDVWAVLEHSLGADTLPCCMESSGRTVLWKWRAVLTRAPGSRLFSEETRHLKGLWF